MWKIEVVRFRTHDLTFRLIAQFAASVYNEENLMSIDTAARNLQITVQICSLSLDALTLRVCGKSARERDSITDHIKPEGESVRFVF